MTKFTAMVCGQCGENYCLETSTYDQLQRSSQTFHCPWGHQRHFPQGPTTEDKLRQERDRLKQQTALLVEEARDANAARERAERCASAARGQVTRLKNRAAAGVCPCCNRTFTNLQRHMAAKHATFTAEEVAPDARVTIQ